MNIRTVIDSDYEGLFNLLSSFFNTHSIFSKDKEFVINYLKEESKKNPLVVCEDDGIKGCLFLVNLVFDKEHSHKVWKFRHFAFDSDDVFDKMVTHVEKLVKLQSQTIKIENTIAETEKGIDLYLKNGYEKEGELKNHYRWGESCFVISKSYE